MSSARIGKFTLISPLKFLYTAQNNTRIEFMVKFQMAIQSILRQYFYHSQLTPEVV